MSKKGGAGIPPAILSYVRKSSSAESGDDDDRALLIPSSGSSFNLTGDAEYLLPKSSSHHSSNSKSSRSYASSSSGSTHGRRRDGSYGGKGKRKNRLSAQFERSSSAGSDSPIKSRIQGRSLSFHSEQSMGSATADSGNDRNPTTLFPIASSSFSEHSTNSDAAGEYAMQIAGNPEKYVRGNMSPSVNTIHSGRSYRSRKSSSSDKTGRSSRRRGKMRREERRRQWIRKWRRRRLLGKLTLTVIYTVLFLYTLLVTVGPLLLHYEDSLEWCPYYQDGNSEHDGGYTPTSGFSISIDKLQQSGQQQQELAEEEQQRRRLSSNGVEYEYIPKDLKEAEIDLLRKTSKDVHSDGNDGGEESSPKYENPDYDDHPCRTSRIPALFYLSLEECDLSRRMAASVVFGGFIGYERRAADRPAGIRTMSLVSLGSCFFTISSQLAFRDSPMTWDSSRVTAAIPSGVGFLGAGLIWKGSLSDGSGGEVHQVHGITTAASVWLAAAVGVGAGGALYAVSAYSTALVILVLRFGPRLYLQHDKGFDYDDEDDEEEDSEEDEVSVSDNRTKRSNAEERIPVSETGRTHSDNYEMHQMDHLANDTTTLKRDKEKYGATDIEQNIVAQLLQDEQRRHIERLNRLGGGDDNPNEGPLSWLTNLLPGNRRQQPYNPYQEITRDREVMRLMRKKKSLASMSSRPSFCT